MSREGLRRGRLGEKRERVEEGGGEYWRGAEGKASPLGEEGGEPRERTDMSQPLLLSPSTKANSWLIVTSSLVFSGLDMVGVEERGWKRDGGGGDGSSRLLRSSRPWLMVPSGSGDPGWQ